MGEHYTSALFFFFFFKTLEVTRSSSCIRIVDERDIGMASAFFFLEVPLTNLS